MGDCMGEKPASIVLITKIWGTQGCLIALFYNEELQTIIYASTWKEKHNRFTLLTQKILY